MGKRGYILTGIITMLITAGIFTSVREQIYVQMNGKEVAMKLVHVKGPCLGTKVKNMASFEYQGRYYSRRVSSLFCQETKPGDIVKLIYLEPYDYVLFSKQNLYIDIGAVLILFLLGLVSFIYGLKM